MASPHPKFDQLFAEREAIQSFIAATPHEQFFKEELLRFVSIAGTVVGTFPNVAKSADERFISHILLRSLIENFVKILYVFDNSALSTQRFEQISNGFQREYLKLYNDISPSFQTQIEPASASWRALPSPPDLKSMLAQVRNIWGNRLDSLYFLYRIGSFDTHGNSLNALFESTFGKTCNFPLLHIVPSVELIADYYLCAFTKISPAAPAAPAALDP